MFRTPRSYTRPIEPVQDKSLKYLYFMDREHPLGDKKGRVLHHRHVASVTIGRWVRPEEVVHHKDHDRANNDPRNLEVMLRRAHARMHRAEEGASLLPDFVKCKMCRKKFAPQYADAIVCSTKCSGVLHERAKWPSDAALARMVLKKTSEEIAAALGVSGTAVRKRCRSRGIKKPPRGYWQKKGAGKSVAKYNMGLRLR